MLLVLISSINENNINNLSRPSHKDLRYFMLGYTTVNHSCSFSSRYYYYIWYINLFGGYWT